MGIRIGIVGLPNVGKSTTFNALTRAQNAKVASYPFSTIEPNQALVPVPDARLDRLDELLGRKTLIHATIAFVDIAGLVAGASRGEGLGNQFLGEVRNTDAILHVVRCFTDENVAHIAETVDPQRDIDIVETELLLADLQQIDARLERLGRQLKGDRKLQPVLDMAQTLRDHINTGKPVRDFSGQGEESFEALARELRFLTAKPMIYAVNVDEADLLASAGCAQSVIARMGERGSPVIEICAQLEEGLAGLSEQERDEYLAIAEIDQSALDRVVQTSYRMLDLISFFTYNDEEVRAWTLKSGTTAPAAAGTIHTDFERGFIRAEVIPFDLFAQYGSAGAARAAGQMRLEGKEYIVQDGDVIYFRFNV